MARNPYSPSAHGACSRELPQPKLDPAIRIVAPSAAGPVELEIRVGGSVRQVAPVEEQRWSEAGPLDPLQELLRNDLIGVDVGSGQRNSASGVLFEGLHTILDKYSGNRVL